MSVLSIIQNHLESCGVKPDEYILSYTKREIYDAFKLHNQELYLPFAAEISITIRKSHSSAEKILNEFNEKICQHLSTMPNFIFSFGDINIRSYAEDYLTLTAKGIMSGIISEGEL